MDSDAHTDGGEWRLGESSTQDVKLEVQGVVLLVDCRYILMANVRGGLIKQNNPALVYIQ